MKRVVTYFRNIVPNCGQTVDTYVDRDADMNGCPEYVLASQLNLDPGLRWNRWDTGVCIFPPPGMVVRISHDGGSAPSLATDGALSQSCGPQGVPRSYDYGIGGSQCRPWVGPTGRADNFLVWLVVGFRGWPIAVEEMSWGAVKGLFR